MISILMSIQKRWFLSFVFIFLLGVCVFVWYRIQSTINQFIYNILFLLYTVHIAFAINVIINFKSPINSNNNLVCRAVQKHLSERLELNVQSIKLIGGCCVPLILEWNHESVGRQKVLFFFSISIKSVSCKKIQPKNTYSFSKNNKQTNICGSKDCL